jgi:hypothetical protein
MRPLFLDTKITLKSQLHHYSSERSGFMEHFGWTGGGAFQVRDKGLPDHHQAAPGGEQEALRLTHRRH